MRPRQQTVMERLERENLRAIDKIVEAGALETRAMWESAKEAIRNTIMREYRQAFGSQTWNVMEAASRGVLHRISMYAAEDLAQFHERSVRHVARVLREVYKQGVLRQAWALDQITPPSRKVALPNTSLLREAASDYRGPDDDTTWKLRWSAWTDAYLSSLNQNLKLGAINSSTIGDAADEVEATRPGSPSADMWDALSRIFGNQTEIAYAMAASDVADANPDFGVDEVWQTRAYIRVCDICEANAGLTKEEASDSIPAHPNCGCFWRLVPRTWVSLLKSGDANDRATARAMDAAGQVPNAMLVRDEEGKLVGATIVKFEDWVFGQFKSAVGQ